MRVLVINCGSSSVKYRVIDVDSGEALTSGAIERIGEGGTTHASAVAAILQDTAAFEPAAVGHRVVHGGDRFHDATLIDDEVIDAIEACDLLYSPPDVAASASLRRKRAR